MTEASGTITAEEAVPNRLRYNGQMADGLTGLYYLGARYYNASLGRFTQEDVIYNDGLNLYAYCNSNPVMYSDPSGFAATQSLNGCNPKNGGEKDSKSGSKTVNGYDTKVNVGQQNKHIPGTNEYKNALNNGQTKSIMYGDANDIQNLLNDKASTGDFIGANKERVNFGQVIGQYVDPDTGVGVETTIGIIHYGKKGAHIVPARPD